MLLDTNVLSELMLLEPNVSVLAWFSQRDMGSLYISAITRFELQLGLLALPSGKRRSRLMAAVSQALDGDDAPTCLAFDQLAADVCADLVALRDRLGRPLKLNDGLIAATAISHQMPLVTRNVRDFERLPQLELINPFDD